MPESGISTTAGRPLALVVRQAIFSPVVTTMISTKGQVVLPAAFRERDGVEAGQRVEVRRLGPGRYLIDRLPAGSRGGLVARLKACPHKGWFKPLPRTETIDDLIRRRGAR